MNLDIRYLIYFSPETSTYYLWDRAHEPAPMRRIYPEDVVCYCETGQRAHEVFDALTDQGLI